VHSRCSDDWAPEPEPNPAFRIRSSGATIKRSELELIGYADKDDFIATIYEAAIKHGKDWGEAPRWMDLSEPPKNYRKNHGASGDTAERRGRRRRGSDDMSGIPMLLARQRDLFPRLSDEERQAVLETIDETRSQEAHDSALEWLYNSSEPARELLKTFLWLTIEIRRDGSRVN
jgi:hypothetical protein